MTDNRRITSVTGAINIKLLKGHNRRSEEEREDDRKGTQDDVH